MRVPTVIGLIIAPGIATGLATSGAIAVTEWDTPCSQETQTHPAHYAHQSPGVTASEGMPDFPVG
jgi:hypothetical protein